MSSAYEGFKSRLITPFKSNSRDFSHLMIPAWYKTLENPGTTAGVNITLAERKPDRLYSLHLHETDSKTNAKDMLMSMDLQLDIDGNLTGLKGGALTLYRRRGNMIFMFDYFVDAEDPSRVNLGGVSKMALEGDDHPPLLIRKEEQREIIQNEGVPLNANWFDTAVAYLTAKAPEQEEVITADFAANTTLLGEIYPVRVPTLA